MSAVEAQGRGVTLVGMGCEQFDVGPESQALSVRLTTGDLPYAPGISFAYRIDEDGTWVRLPQGGEYGEYRKTKEGRTSLVCDGYRPPRTMGRAAAVYRFATTAGLV